MPTGARVSSMLRRAGKAAGAPALACCVAVLGAAAAGCEPAIGPGAVEVREARRVDVAPGAPADALRPPDARTLAGAPPVALPDRWSLARREKARAAWYGAVVDLADPPREPWGVYLPRVVMNAAVWVNGVPIGGGPLLPTPARSWNRPLLLSVPAGALRAGPNRLDVALAVQPTYAGVLAPPWIGPDRALRPAYEWRVFWQTTAVQVAIVLTAYFGLAGALLWLRRREPAGLAWSAAGCLLWAVAMLDPVVRDPPLPAVPWQWLVTSALGASVACFAVGVRRFLAIGRARIDAVVGAVWAAGSAALAAALASGAPRAVAAVVGAWATASLGVALYSARLLLLARRRTAPGERAALGYLPPLAAVALAFVLHDLALASGYAVPPSVLLLPYVGGLIALWGGLRVVERLSDALGESAALNRDLERRVAERGAEIARSYEQIRALERARLLQGERERIMRDVHDGMGGQLASALALVESRRVPSEEIADALRDALDDMRLLIAPLGPTADDLLTLLATWRARIERRLERRGLAFDWQVADLPPLPWLGPSEARHVLRIFQEAVTNVVKHTTARTIAVRTRVGPGPSGAPGVAVEIEDDGGATASCERGRQDGHGVSNMTARAAEIGGALALEHGVRGMRVVLWLPLAR